MTHPSSTSCRLPMLLVVVSATVPVPAAELSGFLDQRAGVRVEDHAHQKRESVAEARLQLDVAQEAETMSLRLRGDLLLDAAADTSRIDLDDGRGWIDLREANVLWYPPWDFMDVKIGRQILTWGTGDLIFINDLFPKDWTSFLIGRDDEYLKAPSDAVKISAFSRVLNLDVVYTPQFDADRFISGHRVSYWNAALGRIAGRDAIVRTEIPSRAFSDDEVAIRLYRSAGGVELAAYGYVGYWKSPAGMNPMSGEATFPALDVVGASARGHVLGGVGNLEIGYYHSADDDDGRDPLVRNSETRVLLGYERQIARDLTARVQFYAEVMDDYGAYRNVLTATDTVRDEVRSVVSLRLTQLLLSQDLTLSVVALASPSDRDLHLRPRAHYRASDHLAVEAGAILSYGEDNSTFYGQFEDGNSIYSGLRYSF